MTATSLSQLNKIGLRPFTPLSKLSAPNVEFREVPGTKKGGTIAIVRQGERPLVYLDELVINYRDSWLSPLNFLAAGEWSH